MPVNLLNESDLNKYLTSVVYTNNEEVPHWVSDKSSQSQENLQNPDWVKEHKDEVVKAILLQYFKKRIREYFMKNEDVPYLESVKSNEKNLPEWCQKALSENKSVFKFDENRITSDLKEKIMTIRDYLYAMADKYVVDTAGLAKKTEKISKIRLDYLKTSNEYADFDDVLTYANLWHEKLAISSKKVRKNEEFYKKSLEGTKFIMELPNNTFAYQLLTSNALDFESDNMGHCVGRGYYDRDVEDGITKIYSIRDFNGESHVTFEVRKNDDGKEVVFQCKGKQNKAPVQKYMDAVQAFVEKMDLDIEGDFQNMGLLKVKVKVDDKKFENKIYRIQSLIDRTVKIPEGSLYDGNINFMGLGLKVLPDLSNLILIGSFDCSYNQLTSLEGAPEKISRYFVCSDNQLTNLKGAPKEMGGSFDCSRNQLTNLDGAPKKISKDFDCSDNQLTSLEGAPEKIGGSFDCSRNQLTNLKGAPEKISGYFVCSDNKLTNLEGAPEKVSGYFVCSDNKLTNLKGAPEKIGGSFDCSRNQLTNLEDVPKKIGGRFDCSRNQLTNLKGAPEKIGGYFVCSDNKLTSLKGAPKKIGGNFDCSYNQLTSLEGSPEKISGSFDCSDNQLTNLKGAPKKISGSFDCSRNQLTSLEGAPEKVGGSFDCSRNQLTNLEGAPEKIGGSFDCFYNQLTSLEGAPKEIGESFNCSRNQLTSLEGAPEKIGGRFNCSRNQLTSLKGAPEKISGYFICSRNQLTNLEGAPEKIGGRFDCSYNQLTSLEGAPEKIGGSFDCSYNQLTSFEGAPKEVGGRLDYSCNPIGKKLDISSLLNNSNGK